MKEVIKKYGHAWLFIFALAVIVISIFYGVSKEKKYVFKDEVDKVLINGIVSTDKGTAYDLKEIDMIDVNKYQKIVIKGHVSEQMPKDTQVLMRLIRISAKIYINNNLLYEYGTKDSVPSYSANAGNVWTAFRTPSIGTGDELMIVLENSEKNNQSDAYAEFVNSLCTGDRLDLFKLNFGRHLFFSISFLIILVLGMLLLLGAVVIKFIQSNWNTNLLLCSMLMITVGLWMEIEYSYISLIIPYGTMIATLETCLLVIMQPILLIYIRNYLNSTFTKFFRVIETIELISIVVFIVCQFNGVCSPKLYQDLMIKIEIPIYMIAGIGIFYDLLKGQMDKLKRYLSVSLLVSMFISGIGSAYHIISNMPSDWIIAFSLLILVLSQFVIAISFAKEQIQAVEKAKLIEKELVESRVAIMLSQIQPHFLYNSLTTIRVLCRRNPQIAEEAVTSFANFLRGNLDSLTRTNMVSFDEELQHVKYYLYLEKLRFGDNMNVHYDIKETAFELPPLTLQPIVENAVRYGVTKKENGGNVYISTYKKNDNYFITIEDDGVGFDVNEKKYDGRTHVGIDNVRMRLKDQCDGTLIIVSERGVGTKAVITIGEGEV